MKNKKKIILTGLSGLVLSPIFSVTIGNVSSVQASETYAVTEHDEEILLTNEEVQLLDPYVTAVDNQYVLTTTEISGISSERIEVAQQQIEEVNQIVEENELVINESTLVAEAKDTTFEAISNVNEVGLNSADHGRNDIEMRWAGTYRIYLSRDTANDIISGSASTSGVAIASLLTPYIGPTAATAAGTAIGTFISGRVSGSFDRGIYIDHNALLNIPVGFGYQ